MVSNRKHVFEDISPLFRGTTRDPILVCLRAIQGKDRSGKRREIRVALDLGQAVGSRELVLRPIEEARDYSGYELSEEIARRYNEDYWIICLWNALLENARDSQLGVELVRAFIKHGIYLTGEELISKSSSIDAKLVKNGLSDRVTYYKRLFNWGQIFRCLRLPEKRAIARRLRNDKSSVHAIKIREISTEELMEKLPEINQILGYARLPTIVREAEEQAVNLRGIINELYINFHFWRDSRRIREELVKVLRSGRPIKYP